MNDITVVISNHNYDKFVDSAIESCLKQTIPCDIIVVDDASTDDSWKVITKYKNQGVKAVRLKKNSGGNARGKNVGICLSLTKYVACLDSDDMLLPDSLESRMLFSDNVDFVHGWSYSVKSTEKYKEILQTVNLPEFKFNSKAKKLMKQAEPRWSFAIHASSVLAKKELYEKFGLYDEEMKWTIDREMWYRWLDHGVCKHFIPQYVSFYRTHSKQVTHDRKRKNPKKCAAMLSQKIVLRKTITSENTMFIKNYDYQSFIGETS